MKWSWRLGRILGVNIYVHFTFLFLLAWVAVMAVLQGGGFAGMIEAVLFILAVFGIVVLHELGHSVAARSYGIPTRNITLYPIGGVAQLQRMPTEPKQELVIALAGPVVNLALALILYMIYIPVGTVTGFLTFSLIGTPFLAKLIWVNLLLAGFNLLPAFPMDGGRVLRAIMAMRMDYLDATRIAVRTGKVMAVFFGVVGLFYNPFLILMAGFIWFSGSQEIRAIRYRLAMDHTFPQDGFRARRRSVLDLMNNFLRKDYGRNRGPRGEKIEVIVHED